MKLLTTTLAATLFIALAGCKSTPKAESASDTNNNRSVAEHIGDDATAVGKGTLDAVGKGIDAVGKGITGVFKGDKDKGKTDHPKKERPSKKGDHPDHPGS